MLRIRMFWLVLLLSGAFVLSAMGPGTVSHAFHFPWDQGHDTFRPNPPDDPNPPDEDNGDEDGDPVELLSGNFFYNLTRHDIRILDTGPPLELLFTYHSQDLFDGVFGPGWHTTLTSMAIKVTDGEERHIIIRQGNGRRKRYLVNADGTIQNPLGVYHQLVENPDGTFTLIFKGGTVHQYGADGRIRRIEDINQRAVVVGYDSAGAIESATTAGGRSLTFTKGADGKIATITDPMIGDYDFTYDGEGRMVSVMDPLGNQTQYVYNSENRMTQIFAPNGVREVLNNYDSQDRVSRQDLIQGRVDFLYDNATRTRVQVNLSAVTTHNFNAAGLPTTTQFPNGTTQTRVWDATLNLVGFTDVDSNTTTFQYDALGNLTGLTDPASREFTFTYEPNYDRVATITDVGAGVTSTISYDDLQESIQVTDVAAVSHTFPSGTYGLLDTGLMALGKVFPFTSRYQLIP